MSSETDLPPVHTLYYKYIQGDVEGAKAPEFWGTIPLTMGQAVPTLKKIREQYGETTENLETLKKLLKTNLRKLGGLTANVSRSIDRLDNGVIEAGQQPMFMGGPSLILNKIAYAQRLGEISGGLVPLFYVADYDGLQPELTNMRVPSPSVRGLMLKYPTQPEQIDTPIYAFKNPSEDWLRKTIEKIESNYRGLMKGVDKTTQTRIIQNLSHAISIVKNAYYSTENVSDWSTKILSTLLNIEADLGIPIYCFSMPGTRPLFQEGFELLLKEPNRTRFIDATNKAVDAVLEQGYRPQIGVRSDDYVPFFYECTSPRCNRTRVELKYRPEGESASLYGKCSKCEQEFSFSINPRSPDLSDIIENITPRVDSRQVIVDSVLPIVAHIGGPGETSYYAEVIPAAQALNIPFPIFMRYSRTFYNTPWNEELSNEIKEQGLPVIASETLFNALNQWVEARNSKNAEAQKQAHRLIKSSVEDSYNTLIESVSKLESEIAEIKQSLRNPGDRGALIRKMKEKQSQAHRVESYLSSAYGRYSPEKFGQEVNWLWIDLGMVTGLRDLMGVYLREYNENTPNSSIFYVNTV